MRSGPLLKGPAPQVDCEPRDYTLRSHPVRKDHAVLLVIPVAEGPEKTEKT
jgi:hypothetical protein